MSFLQELPHLSITQYSQKQSTKAAKLLRGFTLIELLIVMTIIGILAGISLASYSGTQERGRDSRRKTDLDAIKKTLELAKSDSVGQYSYPACNTYDGSGACVLNASSTTPSLSAGSSPYIKAVPTDPKLGTGYSYTPVDKSGAGNCASGLCTSYSLKACLENQTDPQGVADVSCTSGKAYVITPN